MLTLSDSLNNQGKENPGGIHYVKLVEAEKDPSKSLDLSKHTLYLVAPLV